MISSPTPSHPASIESVGLPTGLDAIFVIHASIFIDRRKLIQSQLGAIGLPFEFILDFDIPAISDEMRQRFFGSSVLSPSQQSCALKHWQALNFMVTRNLGHALILEDDVILASDFKSTLNRLMSEVLALEGAHVIFLGCGGHYYVSHDEIHPGRMLYARNQGKFADSYIVSLDAAKRRLQWIGKHGIPRPIDHLFEQIDRELTTNMYWLEPPVVEQGSHNGTFGSTLVKSHPLWFQALQFRWKKMWRRRRHN